MKTTLSEIEQFLRIHDMPASKFGRLAVKDPRFVYDLRKGREMKPATAQRVWEFMRNA